MIDLVGELTSADDVLDLEAAQERYKALPGQLLDSLQKLAALLSALIGAGLVAGRDDLVPAGWRVAAVAVLVVALAAALVGILPLTWSRIYLHTAASMRDHTTRLIRRRGWSLIASGLLLLAGFAVALAGLAVRLLG